MAKVSLLCSILAICVYVGHTNNNLSWVDDLSKYVQNEIHPYQVLIIKIDEQLKFQKRMNDVVLAIGQRTPLWSANFENLNQPNLQLLKLLPALGNPRQTTLFILTKTSQIDEDFSFIMSNLTSLLSIVNRVSGARIRPKCLILHFSRRAFNYENLLRKIWSERFLDVSVLETILLKTSKKHQFMENRSEVCTLHYWNPFLERYTKKMFSSKTKLFPSKLHNLNRHQVKIGVYNYYPFLMATDHHKGKPVIITGLAANLPQEFSRKMNFKLINDVTYLDKPGLLNYDKEKTSGVFHQLTHNQIQFIAVENAILGPRGLNILERSTVTGYVDFCALVPIFPSENASIVISKDFLNAGIFIICLLIFTWNISRLMKFNIRYWPVMYIVQLVIGAPVPTTPRRTQERIMFACIFLSSIIYSSWIYIAMTNIVLEKKGEVEFNQIADVVHYNLTYTFPNERWYRLARRFNIDYAPLVFQKNSISPSITCVATLLQYKNVSCVMARALANEMIQINRDTHGQPLMKIVEESVVKAFKALKLEPGSPFVERFNELILKLQVAGVHQKWYEIGHILKYPKLRPDHLTGLMQIQHEIFFVPLIGFALALCTFIAEIIAGKFCL